MPGMLARRMPIYGARKRLQERVLRETHEVKSSTAVPDYGTRGRLIGHYAVWGRRRLCLRIMLADVTAGAVHHGGSPTCCAPTESGKLTGLCQSVMKVKRAGGDAGATRDNNARQQQRSRCRAEARRYENLCARATLAKRAAPRRAIAEQEIRGQNMWSIQIWREGKPSSAKMPRKKVWKD